ncbi:MAG TPA: crosslink repair DNA glycosylase YcaQ family protein, partial [Actinomycetota bacterium]|nr:crosslink repair DNA glycosylase YcaQ family protein [Actinomycetota bacterium]
MAPAILDPRSLHRALLARQLLLERAGVSIPAAVERVGCLQTQYAPAGYVALRSRLEAFERDDLTRALERKRVVQAWVMRSTIHVATPRDYWWGSAGVRRARREGWVRAFRRDARDGTRAAERVARFLRDEGPRR